MKCTRQRCQVAPRTLTIAAFSPSCASEITSFAPRRPRRAKLRQVDVLTSQGQSMAEAIPVDRGERGDVLPRAAGVRRLEERPGKTPKNAGRRKLSFDGVAQVMKS